MRGYADAQRTECAVPWEGEIAVSEEQVEGTQSNAAPEGASTDGNASSGATSTAGDGFKPITSQDELNAAIADRIARERNKFKDYSDLKAKAARLDELEQASKSEMEKAIDRVTRAEAQVAEIPSQVAAQLRDHLVELHKIDKDDAELFLTATEPDLLLKQVSRLMSREKPRGTNYVAREGTTRTTKPSDERETARDLFGS